MTRISTSTVHNAASASAAEKTLAPAGAPPGVTLPNPTVRLQTALGLSELVAYLAEDCAKSARKAARDDRRTMREAQQAALNSQVQDLHRKADLIRKEAMTQAVMGYTGAACSIVGAGVSTSTSAGGKVFSSTATATGKAISDTSGPTAKWAYGADQAHAEADATGHAAHAKRAETLAEEHDAFVKQCDSTIEKAHQALQSLVQSRAQVAQSLAILKPA